MRTAITLDRAGRVVLPKPLRDELHLAPGDTLDVTVEGDTVTLRPRRTLSPLQKERGVWVWHTDQPLSAAETNQQLRDLRAARDQRNGRQD